jgi:nicotinate-nucleotide--dimethylbenzimidazole phosphoribosyltransferase
MRLGEGSGCPLAFLTMEAACAVMNEMATFAEAAINDDYLEEIRKGDQFTVKGAEK